MIFQSSSFVLSRRVLSTVHLLNIQKLYNLHLSSPPPPKQCWKIEWVAESTLNSNPPQDHRIVSSTLRWGQGGGILEAWVLPFWIFWISTVWSCIAFWKNFRAIGRTCFYISFPRSEIECHEMLTQAFHTYVLAGFTLGVLNQRETCFISHSPRFNDPRRLIHSKVINHCCKIIHWHVKATCPFISFATVNMSILWRLPVVAHFQPFFFVRRIWRILAARHTSRWLGMRVVTLTRFVSLNFC